MIQIQPQNTSFYDCPAKNRRYKMLLVGESSSVDTKVGESSSGAAATPKENKKVPTDKNDADGQRRYRETENQDEAALKKIANKAPNVSDE